MTWGKTMMRFRVAGIAILVALGATYETADGDRRATPQPAASKRPNVLLAIADDWSFPHASAYGDRTVSTPTFDRIAREGVRFTHAFVASPSCTPSRAALLTGQAVHRLEEGGNLHSFLSKSYPSIPISSRTPATSLDSRERAGGLDGSSRAGAGEIPQGRGSTASTSSWSSARKEPRSASGSGVRIPIVLISRERARRAA